MKLTKLSFGLMGIALVALFIAACGGAAAPQTPSAPQQVAPAQAPAAPAQAPAAPAQPAAPAPAAPAQPAAAPAMAPAAVPSVAIAAVAQQRRPDPTPTGQQAIPGGILIPLAGFDLGHTDPHRNTSVAELSYMVHIYPASCSMTPPLGLTSLPTSPPRGRWIPQARCTPSRCERA